MDDTARNEHIVVRLARLIDEHKGKNTVVLDVAEKSNIADYFVITTGSSAAHIRGLVRNITAFLLEAGLPPKNRRRHLDDEEWVLLDCRDIVVHVFNEQKRGFYDLERLWFDGRNVDYSSNSSSS